jgi:hypothetical protein
MDIHSNGNLTTVKLYPCVNGLKDLCSYLDKVFSNPDNAELFALRKKEVCLLEISAGQPHGDYGQVVEITFRNRPANADLVFQQILLLGA